VFLIFLQFVCRVTSLVVLMPYRLGDRTYFGPTKIRQLWTHRQAITSQKILIFRKPLWEPQMLHSMYLFAYVICENYHRTLMNSLL